MDVDEKSVIFSASPSSAAKGADQRGRRPSTALVFISLGATLLLFLATRSSPVSHSSWRNTSGARDRLCGLSQVQNPETVWDKIKPSKDLDWTPCYEDKLCARFIVPLDYAIPDGPQAAVALVKIPSNYTQDDARYLGPVLFNPGGPGVSGVDIVRDRGALFRTILGPGYDLIGFDPRGVGRTTPRLRAFPEDGAERVRYGLAYGDVSSNLNASSHAFTKAYASSQLFGALAVERMGDVMPYVGTAAVARDMLAITRAHGYEKIKYWGFSYGSVLGITFAAMFPDHIERLIVDGVCDTYNYYETLWSNNLRDTDATLYSFYEACAAAPECALHESSASAISSRVEKIFASLKARPLPVVLNGTGSGSDYGIVDYSTARAVVFGFLYSPYFHIPGRVSAPGLASALAAAERGDGLPLWNYTKRNVPKFKCDCDGTDSPVPPPLIPETTMAIACGDGDVVPDDFNTLQDFMHKMGESSSFAEQWAIRVTCAAWKGRAVERFTGPFIGNTSHPILLIGNTADPVTPLWNAKKMSKGFKDAAVLTQRSSGHCSISATSLCTARAVRRYFQDGVLPEANTVCEVEDVMFGEAKNPEDDEMQSLSVEDAELLHAWRTASEAFEVSMLHLR